ncbi:MAG: CopG family antitoxin [Alphaproteobacteria bacterium]
MWRNSCRCRLIAAGRTARGQPLPVRYQFQPKAARLNMRLPAAVLDAVKSRAKAQGVPDTRFIREVLEHATAEPE